MQVCGKVNVVDSTVPVEIGINALFTHSFLASEPIIFMPGLYDTFQIFDEVAGDGS